MRLHTGPVLISFSLQHYFIRLMELGLQKLLGEKALSTSGGKKQDLPLTNFFLLQEGEEWNLGIKSKLNRQEEAGSNKYKQFTIMCKCFGTKVALALVGNSLDTSGH